MSYDEIRIDVDQNIKNIIFLVDEVIKKLFPVDYEQKIELFNYQYQTRIEFHQSEDLTDYSKMGRLITEFKPSLEIAVELGPEFDQIVEILTQSFNVMLGGARRQLTGEQKRSGIDSFKTKPTLKYYCSVCRNFFAIPSEEEEKILNSDEVLTLPSHHDQEMQILIEDNQPVESAEKKMIIPEEDFSVTQFMDNKTSGRNSSNADFITLTSVGIDIGTSTSHLIFSKLKLKREVGFMNMTGRYILESRQILYEGNIINTPLLDESTIDVDSVITFIEEEFIKAGIKKEDVDTGAVIVTGETAKKKNAEAIVRRISSESGKFVSATAGPNYESVLGIMGSGILAKSDTDQNTILNIDVGGGTSNLAIATKGIITSTSCINVGGRLLGLEPDLTIWRMDQPTLNVMEYLGMKYSVGDQITTTDLKELIETYANALVEVIQGAAKTEVAKMLMMTSDLEFPSYIDAYSFSGGVAEFIYTEHPPEPLEYRDMGIFLAQELRRQMEKKGLNLIEPINKIRATVIGAGAFSLSVSGTTCHVAKSVTLPLNNIPVIHVNVQKESFSVENTKNAIQKALRSFDINLAEDLVALYFEEPIYHTSSLLSELARGIELGLMEECKIDAEEQKPLILIFRTDLAKMLSIHIRKETQLTEELIVLDEIVLEAGDWIDIGKPLAQRNVYPVAVKSLIFKNNQ